MAFVPSAPRRLAIRTSIRTSRFAATRTQRHSLPTSSRKSYLHMCTKPDQPTEQEASVPLSSLRDAMSARPTSDATSVNAAPQPQQEAQPEEEDNRTEVEKEMDRLRAAEKFITVDEGIFECTACSYMYEPKKGIKQSGIAPETPFRDVPDSFVCPVCRSPKSRFVSKKKIIAGFADNQSYGFGSNTMTSAQKSALIYGGLLLCFLLLLSGYALN